MDKKRIVLIFILFFLSVSGNTGMALQIKDINSATVSLLDHSEQDLAKGFQQAFQEVLIKISGNTGVMTLPAVQNALPRINHYVKSYHYEEPNVELGKPDLLLQVTFDTRGLHHLLKQAHQAVWGDDRPLTLIWLSLPMEQRSRRYILSHAQQHPIQTALKKLAKVRGVPILFPMMDLEDQNNVASAMPAALPTFDQVKSIFQRYGVDSVLAGFVSAIDSHHVEAEWTLFLNDKPYEWQTSGADLVQAVSNGLDRAADMMAIQFATIESSGMHSEVLLQIYGVYSLIDYVQILSQLKRLNAVANVSVRDMTDDRITLQITTIGSVNELMTGLKPISRLIPATKTTDAGPHMSTLFYRWISSALPANTTEKPVLSVEHQ